MRHIALFAGIHGFKGFDDAGMQTVAFVEIDKDCQRVLRRHCPDVPIISDVRDAGRHNLPDADIISFGSPCQDLSRAGRKAGLHGEKSKLFFEAIRIIGELKPAFAVWENVPDAVRSNAGRDFAAVLNSFRECGARDIAWRTLDAQYGGVPQRRRRIFLIADFRGERAGQILFESESDIGSFKPRRKTGEETARITGTLSASGSGTARTGNARSELDMLITPYTLQSFGEYQARNVDATLRSRDSKDATDLITVDLQQITSRQNGSNPRPDDPSPTLSPGQRIAVCALNTRNGQVSDDISGTIQSGYHGWSLNSINPIVFLPNAGAKARSVAASETTSPTIRAMGNNRQIPAITQRTGIRRLTPRECERLMGFEDDWTAFDADGKPISDTARYRMLGNSVVVNETLHLGKQFMKAVRDG